MAKRYSIADARNHLPALIHDAEKGATVEITRRGKPVAVLLSASSYQRLDRARPSLWKSLERFRQEHDLAALDAASVFEGLRDPGPGREMKW